MDNYIPLKEAANKMGISSRKLRTLYEEGRIDGVMKFGEIGQFQLMQ